jgi:1A family penicillin-binding protein
VAVYGTALVVLAGAVPAAIFLTRSTLAIDRLARGGGDTEFCTSDGRPWFRMDEQPEPVPLAAVAPALRNAVIAVEDRRFYRHHGLDPIGIGRAASRDLRTGEVVEGGSTITQQLARTLFLSNSRTWGRKAEEAVLALLLEARLTKDQILEIYLNRVFLGGGTYGVEPMASRLFGKHAKDLSLSEAAMMAGLIRAPSALSPWTNPGAAVRRSHVVLQRMREEGYISVADQETAEGQPPQIRPYAAPGTARSGYVREYLRQQFRNDFGGDHPPGWRVRTTVVPGVQQAAEHAVEDGLMRLGIPGLEAALVAFNPKTGDLLALVGGRDYREAPYNRATRTRRQPGSAFKPLVFAAALGRGFSPVSVLHGLSSAATLGPEEWAPHNAHLESEDELTLRAALLESNNRAAASLQQRIGSAPVLSLARSLGLPPQPDVPSLALGTGSVSPFELTLAYAAFPNGGLLVRSRAIVDVRNAQGDVVTEYPVAAERVLSEDVAFQMVSMLEDVVERGTASAVRRAGLRFPVAGKTGTTEDFRDAWFVGFSSAVVAGVWVGFDEPRTMGGEAYASRVALPVWVEFMRRSAGVLPPAQPFEPPEDLRQETLCRVSYLQPLDQCPTYTEYFKAGDEIPSRPCPIHGGSLRQRLQRALGDLFDTLGKGLKGLLGRR